MALAHAPAARRLSIEVPDLGDARRNRALEELIEEMARRLAHIVRNA
jgi:hypothetical protein